MSEVEQEEEEVKEIVNERYNKKLRSKKKYPQTRKLNK